MDKLPAHTITLEKAGRYRGKLRFTIAEIPELGMSVAPEVDAARWLLLRGADPTEVDPFGRTTGTDFLIGNAAVPIS